MAKKPSTKKPKPMVNGQERFAMREANAEVIKNLPLPKEWVERLAKTHVARQTKFLVDSALLKSEPSPYTLLESVATVNPLETLANGLVKKKTVFTHSHFYGGLKKWGVFYGFNVKKAEPDETNTVKLDNFFEIGREPEIEDILNLARTQKDATWVREGVFAVSGVVFDTAKLTVNRKPVKPVILVYPCGTKVRTLTAVGTLYFLLSGALNAAQRKKKDARTVFSGYIDLYYGKSMDARAISKQDEATQAYFASKPPVYTVDWTPWGFDLRSFEEIRKGKAEIYKAVTDAAEFLNAHYQGSFFYDMRTQVLPMEIDLETGDVIMVAKDLEKLWKRGATGFPQACQMENPDTGYFRTANGLTHQGRRVAFTLTKNGIPFPYLGMATSSLNNRELADLFKVIYVAEHEYVWAGDLRDRIKVPVNGTTVTEGQDLLPGAPESTPARQSGVVDITAPLSFENGNTTITIEVKSFDRQGEFKLRGITTKCQPSTVSVLGMDVATFHDACRNLGLPVPQVCNGDHALLSGLLPGDPEPVLHHNVDSEKVFGPSASSAGIVSISAETFEEVVNYSPRKHYEGEYKPMIDRFLTEQQRTFTHMYAVTREVMEVMLKANRPDTKVRAYTDLETKRTMYFILHTEEGYIGYQLLKVESSPVKDLLSRSRFPLETAVMARTLGMTNYAEEIFNGGKVIYEAVKALHNSVVLRDAEGTLRLPDGRTLAQARVLKVNVRAEQAEALVRILRKIAMNPKLMPRTILFADEYVTDAGETILRNQVLINPAFLRTLGGGAHHPETLASIFAQLCTAIADHNADLASSLVPRLAGKVRALADSLGNAKRLNRGSEVVVTKTVGGMTPDGWVALSYHGKVAMEMARAAGFFKFGKAPCVVTVSRKRKKSKLKKALPIQSRVLGLGSVMVPDVRKLALSGPKGSITRSPQQAPLPVRYWFPDAPEEVWDLMVLNFEVKDGAVVLDRLVPEGAVRCKTRLEPHRVYMSPRDSAWCHGDHDGDLRQFHVSQNSASIEELLRFNVEEHRLKTLRVLENDPKDPVVEAFKIEPKKSTISAKAFKKTLKELHEQNERTIKHQTLTLGQGYNLAHVALTTADRDPNPNSAACAHSVWVGAYEVNLGGMTIPQEKLFEILDSNPYLKQDNSPDVERWEEEVRIRAAKAGWTSRTADMLMRFGKDLKAAAAVQYGWDYLPLKGGNLVRALHGALYRRISAGCFDGKLHELVTIVGEGYSVKINDRNVLVLDMIREFADAGSISARIVIRFFDEVYPLIAARLNHDAAQGDDQDGGL